MIDRHAKRGRARGFAQRPTKPAFTAPDSGPVTSKAVGSEQSEAYRRLASAWALVPALAFCPRRQQALRPCQLQRRRVGVLRRDQRLDSRRQFESDRRIERVYAVLAAGGIRRRAQVRHGRVVGQRDEYVPESLGQIDRAPVHVVQLHAIPAPVRRRPHPYVDNDVQHRPRAQLTYFACPGGTSAKWMPRTVPRRETEVFTCRTDSGCPTASANGPSL